MYYVYELRDPRSHKAFYVGKGQGERAWQHQREVINGKATSNQLKIAKIKEILDLGMQVEIAIVAEYDDESDALDHEFHLIDKDSSLTNVMDGGLGGLNPLALARQRVRRIEKMLAQLLKIKDQATRKINERRIKLGLASNERVQGMNRGIGVDIGRLHKRIKAVRRALEIAKQQLAKFQV